MPNTGLAYDKENLKKYILLNLKRAKDDLRGEWEIKVCVRRRKKLLWL